MREPQKQLRTIDLEPDEHMLIKPGELIDIVELSPLTLQDRRIYNLLILRARLQGKVEILAASGLLPPGRLWLRLVASCALTPLASADALRQTLGQLGQYGHPDEALTGFLGRFIAKPGTGSHAMPPLLRAGQAAQAWTSEYAGAGEGRADRLSTAGLSLAACVCRGTPVAAIALPLWSATPSRLRALAGKAGATWLVDFLDCVTDAAQRAGQELTRLQAAEHRIGGLTQTARSHLPSAADLVLRLPVPAPSPSGCRSRRRRRSA
jgi:hypothetical protein